MSEVIVDTNVAVVANRQNPNVSDQCVGACIGFLIEVQNKKIILIDTADDIRNEYAAALAMRRPYELGAQFLLYVLQNQFNPKHVKRVELEKDQLGEFLDFPSTPELRTFDKSDRKFAALAKKTGSAVTNAVDSDWADHIAALNANGIEVDFICGPHQVGWFKA